jgi:glutamate:GABA antiporter
MEQPLQQSQLKRELKLPDLVLMQVLVVLGIGWIGYAAKQGSTHVILWIAAILGFYVPLAAVVVFLSRAIPLEGGMYQWLKEGFSPFAGYMAGWNYSIFFILLFANDGAALANSLAYAVGPSWSWMISSKTLMVVLNVLVWSLALWANIRGLHLVKWLSGAGSLLLLAMGGITIWLLIQRWISATPAVHPPFSLASPGLSLVSLAVFSKMSINALSGFEGSSIIAGECWAPERNIARSVWIAAPLIAAIYILGTGTVVAYIRPEDIDLVAPLPQLLRVGLSSTQTGLALATATILAGALVVRIQMMAVIGMVSRLPMVAGWDGLMPSWWSQLHPHYGTPAKALTAITVASLAIGTASLLGVGEQEAVQVTTGAATGALCVVYLLLFGLVAFGLRHHTAKPPWWLRLAALAGFLSAAVSLVFQVAPLVEVVNSAIFALKVGGSLVAANLLGAGLYWRGARQLESATTPVG